MLWQFWARSGRRRSRDRGRGPGATSDAEVALADTVLATCARASQLARAWRGLRTADGSGISSARAPAGRRRRQPPGEGAREVPPTEDTGTAPAPMMPRKACREALPRASRRGPWSPKRLDRSSPEAIMSVRLPRAHHEHRSGVPVAVPSIRTPRARPFPDPIRRLARIRGRSWQTDPTAIESGSTPHLTFSGRGLQLRPRRSAQRR